MGEAKGEKLKAVQLQALGLQPDAGSALDTFRQASDGLRGWE